MIRRPVTRRSPELRLRLFPAGVTGVGVAGPQPVELVGDLVDKRFDHAGACAHS
ncbi:hypothetical protein [Kitasatospora sp. NPDC057015]|uniref:hypothetical protein n=1 Tax=Kitasatospora sp. NPDC057015 TaxID=3346001 RepID=UPI00362E410E